MDVFSQAVYLCFRGSAKVKTFLDKEKFGNLPLGLEGAGGGGEEPFSVVFCNRKLP